MARTSALATSAKGGSRAKSLEQRPCTRTATFGTGIGGLHLLDDIAHTDWPDWIYRTDRHNVIRRSGRSCAAGHLSNRWCASVRELIATTAISTMYSEAVGPKPVVSKSYRHTHALRPAASYGGGGLVRTAVLERPSRSCSARACMQHCYVTCPEACCATTPHRSYANAFSAEAMQHS